MSVLDLIYKRMGDPAEAVVESKGESELAKFYGGLSCFVTGGTDLLGKCLIEKLLRDCPDIKRIYLLIRLKKGEDFQDKCNKLYEDSAFDTLRKTKPNFKDKITPIKGDLTQERLGLNENDYKAVVANADLIFHNGAATKLDERINIALRTNVHGTRRMLELARDCKHLKAFCLVSTAFSHCHDRYIEEKFYGAPADIKGVDDMIAADTETIGLSKDALRMLIGDWPNVYSFSKAIAEDLVRRTAPRSHFACFVFRPSVVISAHKEPTSGWCDSKNGPALYVAKIAMGAIHVIYKIDYPCDLIPADWSVNAMLVCAWDAIDRWQIEPEAFVYNYGTSQERQITMSQIHEKMMEDPNAFVTAKIKRKSYIIFATNFFMYFALRVLLDYIPALITDALAIVHGNTPEAWRRVRESMGDQCRLQRFLAGNWRVRMPETLKACERLNPRDRELFRCDVRELDWSDYFLIYWRGIRRYALQDTVPIEDEGRRCPCRCPCKCACYGVTMALLYLVYYSISALLF